VIDWLGCCLCRRCRLAGRVLVKFYRNFLIKNDNGRSSLRIANTFSLKVDSVELEATGINLHCFVCAGVGYILL
jgi:hypothetical protein